MEGAGPAGRDRTTPIGTGCGSGCCVLCGRRLRHHATLQLQQQPPQLAVQAGACYAHVARRAWTRGTEGKEGGGGEVEKLRKQDQVITDEAMQPPRGGARGKARGPQFGRSEPDSPGLSSSPARAPHRAAPRRGLKQPEAPAHRSGPASNFLNERPRPSLAPFSLFHSRRFRFWLGAAGSAGAGGAARAPRQGGRRRPTVKVYGAPARQAVQGFRPEPDQKGQQGKRAGSWCCSHEAAGWPRVGRGLHARGGRGARWVGTAGCLSPA